MPHRTKTWRRSWKERALCLLLSAVLLIGMAPGITLTASAHWADEYLDQLVDWGIMRDDQIGDPDSAISRADFVAIINRAYGYTQTGSMPFVDVQPTDWFYDDISIAYNAGYIAGTSPTTADPNGTLTREMATCILARNMMMKDTPAESLAFTDSRDVSDWARGLVKTAVDNYIISGYPDNSFAPQKPVTKGEMAALVTRCVGNPLNQPGDYTLDDVFDNVTITSSGVTLRDTTISGDLYVSAGVGLGNVKLENVKVLGRIIVSGTGESEKGDASVVMRNLTADEMLVDNMRSKYVTVRAEGLTQIGQTTVRTPAYLEDNTPDANGLRQITLQGGTGAQLDLAGRIKEVVSTAPRAKVTVAKGTVQKLTVDENSTDSTVQLDRNTEVKELNLDVASNVTGSGDVNKMNINAPGVTSAVLPENTYIRPGLTGNMNGDEMDHAAAEEASTNPKLLSGYPVASDVAPTSLQGSFATNKKGTVYWAVSNITDGSVSASELVSKPSYGSKSVKNGSISVPSAGTPVNAKITGLTTGGSYYLSAVMVDARGKRSPVKVISFTTPDNSKPAFGKGYPYMSLVTDTLAQATVMATKSCKLYYAVLPSGAQAPTANEMRSASVSGNLGYAVLDVVKNTELTFTASSQLEELKDYVIYFWLSDADGANSSNIQSLKFKTEDRTAPSYDPAPSGPEPATTSVKLTAGLSEAGTIYWAAVPRGKAYPLPNNQSNPLSKDNIMSGLYDDEGKLIDANGGRPVSARLDSEYAMLQIKKGQNATKKGSVKVTKAGTDVTINVTGLAKEGAYDLYYIAQDSAGNFAKTAGMITIQTLDTTPPLVYQYFSDYQGDKETENPMSNSDVILQFNETINAGFSEDLLTLYRVGNGQQVMAGLSAAEARSQLKNALKDNIVLYWGDIEDGKVVPDGKPGDEAPWINYENAVIQPSVTDETKIEIVFPGKSDKNRTQAVSLTSGDWFGFQLTGIRDYSKNQTVPSTLNPRSCKGTKHVLDYFNTVFADVALEAGDGTSAAPVWRGKDSGQETDLNDRGTGLARVDASFFMEPKSVKNSAANLRYEIALLASEGVSYDLYYRIISDKAKKEPQIVKKTGDTGETYELTAKAKEGALPGGDAPDENGWIYLGNKKNSFTGDRSWDSGTVCTEILGARSAGDFPVLQDLSEEYTYEFAVSVTEKELTSSYPDWNGKVSFRAYVLASGANALWTFVHPGKLTVESIGEWSRGISDNSGRSIGSCKTDDFVTFTASFLDTRVPVFQAGPKISVGPTFANVEVTLNRNATVYYAVFPKDQRPITYFTKNDPKTTDTGIKVTPGETVYRIPAAADEFWKLVSDQTALPEDTAGKLYEYTGEDNVKRQLLQFYTIGEEPSAQKLSDGDTNFPRYPHGIFKYTSAGVPATIPIDKEHSKYELEPETDYYIYMVIEGGSPTLSQVYVYNFHTDIPARPQIRLRNGGDGTIGISTTNSPAISANIDYFLLTTSDLGANAIFSQKLFEDNHAKIAKPDDVDDLTVIEALMNTYKSGTGGTNSDIDSSIFDVYAKDDTKNIVAAIIRNNSADSGQFRGQTSIVNNVEKVVNQTKSMNAGDYYSLLAVGRNAAGGFDGFKAIDNIQVPDREPPRIDQIITSGRMKTNGTVASNGRVTINFTKPVYLIQRNDSNAVRIAVANNDTNKLSDPIDRKDDYYGVLNVLSGTGLSKLDIAEKTETCGATQSFSFSIEGMEPGQTIVFFSGNYRIANESGQTDEKNTSLVLILREKVASTSDSDVKTMSPYFEITYKDSKGKTVKLEG